ncbi:DUF2314 domain-containing protein [bacterium]|nr:DUF2314 domain-containing protein [bacterium]
MSRFLSVVRSGGLSLSVIASLTSCAKTMPESEIPKSNIPNFAYRRDNDPVLAAAAEKARMSFDKFRDTYKNCKAPNSDDFVVKFPVKENGNTELFWLNVTSIDGNKISGTYNSDGIDIPSVHQDAPATTMVDLIEDWKFDDGYTSMGGFSCLVFAKDTIAQLNGIDTSGPDKGAEAKKKLAAHWKDLEAQAKTKKVVEMYHEDLDTLKEIQLVERLYKGNHGVDGTVDQIADICGLPPGMVQHARNFYELRKQDFKRKR